MNPHIPIPDVEILSLEIKERLSSMPSLNVFRMAANAPASFNGFPDFASSILFEREFDAHKRDSRFLESTRVRLEEESILENDSGPLTDHFKG